MLNAIIRFALHQRLLTIAVALFFIGFGTWQITVMPIDVFPDLNRPRVVIMTMHDISLQPKNAKTDPNARIGSNSALELAGTVKTYVIDSHGREQVQGFFLPGEVIGLNAIHGARYPCNAVAVDTVMLCRFSFPMMATLAGRMPGLQRHLFSLLSQDIGKASLLAGSFTADERLAAFIVMLSRRFAERGFSPTRMRLTMARTDIANYLRLAPETVSRVLRRLQAEGILQVDRRDFEILDMAGLEALARDILRD